MSKIDLSKAKIGDKFRTRDGLILTYDKEYINRGIHILYKESGIAYLFLENGNYMVGEEMHPLDLVEQVFDESFDTKERDIRTNHEMEKAVEVAKEEKQELQCRQEVISLAEKLVVNEEMMKSHRDLFESEVHACAKTLTTYPAFVIRSAEDFIKYKNQYLKDGKL